MSRFARLPSVAPALIFGLAVGLGQPAFADGPAKIRKSLETLLPDIKIDSIERSPIDGLYEVLVGTQLMYVTGDGRYYIDGRIVDLEKRVDLTEPRLAAARLKAVERVGEDNMIIFEPPGKTKHTVTVFTDIDCGYCRKLHKQIDGYGEEGIRIRYLFFPRAGKGSPSYDEAVSVWCSDDRQAAMTAAKSGKVIQDKQCPNPVDRHLALGHEMGIRGTPALLLESGDLVPGYVAPEQLAAMLDQASGN
ncbi:protein-disulfide isomerase [Thioflavicoccus mobilis 8321]|uniref:Thiol:disulfide interchange protein n=1 Tax=Thioflavicoccus mobilis 8321 TaxID=765912 RepID=L0GWA5_9GAMM|nr:DsbC family protein [Thioflavicoccus mobilis]AGA90271.1 protein-disulfide isomerase [Thioflavicoccus mobilis 8321]